MGEGDRLRSDVAFEVMEQGFVGRKGRRRERWNEGSRGHLRRVYSGSLPHRYESEVPGMRELLHSPSLFIGISVHWKHSSSAFASLSPVPGILLPILAILFNLASSVLPPVIAPLKFPAIPPPGKPAAGTELSLCSEGFGLDSSSKAEEGF